MNLKALTGATACLALALGFAHAPQASGTYPGDCNGDWEVSIGEVQRGVNMFLGIEPPACEADANGDGEVSIGEVQRVVNVFLGDLPEPRLVGLDTDGDGEADLVDADADGTLDAAFSADCSAQSPATLHLVSLYAGPSPSYSASGLPSGMSLDPAGALTYAPPCSDEGGTFTPSFFLAGAPQGLAAPFRVTRSLSPRIVGLDTDGDGVADITDANGDGLLDADMSVDCDYTAPASMRLVAADAGDPPAFEGFNLPAGMTLGADGTLLFDPSCDQEGLTYMPNFSVDGSPRMVARFGVVRLPKVGIDVDGDGIADVRDRDGDGEFDRYLVVRCGAPEPTAFRVVGIDAGSGATFSGEGLEPWMALAESGQATFQTPCDGAEERVYRPAFRVVTAGRATSAPVSLPVPVYRQWVDFEAMAPWFVCPEDAPPPEPTVVTAFDRAYHYFGSENRRTLYQEVEFPPAGAWSQIALQLQLECPESGLCDIWDRLGSVQLVLNPEAPEAEWELVELARHITPYKMGMCETIDVTPLASLLRGPRLLQSFIDTWVGPGHSSGEGWLITVKFIFYPGVRPPADEVINVWGRRNITVGQVDPAHSVDAQIDPVTVSIPSDAWKVEAHLTTTGHSFGNSLNCAEFCRMRQDLFVNGTRNSVDPWRADCEFNPHSPQSGTWRYDRNGWCPGAIVTGHVLDITEQVHPGQDNVLDFDIRLPDGSEYNNTDPVDLLPYEVLSVRLYVYR